MPRFLSQLIPFVLMGVAIVAFAFGIVLLAYLFLLGAIIGFILFIMTWIKNKFFRPTTIVKTKKTTGRIIDSDDWKKL
ncbi:MAG: hypothetical protein KIT56_01965 [Gammaproteobacteria bacterium]|nr:hypothetical protein [Gammaproteobacteria bacterium]MCW5582650.1 hypothetical protein [Gammaproteobacteria bacterium]